MMKKIMSILLSLALVLGLLPTIAMADEAYPTYVNVPNSAGNIIQLSDKKYLASNNATSAGENWSDGIDYVARYDASSGTLYLKGYEGGLNGSSGIVTGISASNEEAITISLSGTNSITVSGSGDAVRGITAGTLTITGDGSLTVKSKATNDSTYGIYAEKGMTISANVDVSAISETTGYSAYGLYANNGNITLNGSDMKVTAKTNNADSSKANGIYACRGAVNVGGKLTVDLDSCGTGIYANNSEISTPAIKLDCGEVAITGNANYGLHENSTKRNTNVAGIAIQNNSKFTMTEAGNGIGIYAGSNNIKIAGSTVDISGTGYLIQTNATTELSIENSEVTLVTSGSNAVYLKGGGTTSIDLSASGTVTAKANTSANCPIAGKVTLGTGTDLVKGTYNSSLQNYYGIEDGSNKVVQFTHHEDYPASVYVDSNKQLNSGAYFKTLDSEAITGAPTDGNYVAWYKDGVLTLNNYSGGDIGNAAATANDFTIKLIGENTVNGGQYCIYQPSTGGTSSVTITSDSGGKLMLNAESSDNVWAINANESTGSGQNEVVIGGNASVTIKATTTGTDKECKGIYAKNITIKDSASLDITCKAESNTYAGYVYGTYSCGTTTVNTSGDIDIDVSKAGGESATSYGLGGSSGNTLTLTKVGNLTAKWKNNTASTDYTGAAFYPTSAEFDAVTNSYAKNTTKTSAASRSGKPYTVGITNGYLKVTVVDVDEQTNEGQFLAGDTVSITPAEKKTSGDEDIPFAKWISDDVTITNPTTKENSFVVPENNVSVTATYNPFSETPSFTPTGTTNTDGTLTFKTVVKTRGSEYFSLVAEADKDDTSKYKSINPDSSSDASPYEYSVSMNSTVFSAGKYYVAAMLDGDWYLSELFTVDYVPKTANISLDQSGTVDFGSKEAEYSAAPDAKTITITNNGTAATGALTISLSGTNASSFTLSKSSITDIAAAGTDTFTVQPKTGLAVGTYTATVTVSGESVTSKSFDVKFVVTAKGYDVKVTSGTGMTPENSATWSGVTNVDNGTYTAKEGYYFPTDYSVATVNGISVRRDSYTQITVYGSPTAKTEIILPDATAKTKPDTPSASFIAESENGGTLSYNGDCSSMKYSVKADEWKNITGVYIDITGVTTEYGIKVKKPATDTTLESDVQEIKVTQASAPTSVTAKDCTTSANNDGMLKGVDSTMEYKKSDADTWTTISDSVSDITGLKSGMYYVRVKAKGLTLASKNTEVTIKSYELVPAQTPKASFTANGRNCGTLSITSDYKDTIKYCFDGSNWCDVTSASMSITGVTVANGIKVKDMGDGTTTSESEVLSITVTEGAKPTGLTVTQPSTVGGLGQIATDNTHEYNTNGGDTYSSCDGALKDLSEGTYYIRVKASGSQLASETESYTINEYVPTEYKITVEKEGEGNASATPDIASEGAKITLKADASSGQHFKEWKVLEGGVTIASDNTFTMPANDVKVKAIFEEDTPETYTVTVKDDGNGTAEADPSSATEGTTITLTNSPKSGYKFKEWEVVSGGITITDDKFTMPTSNVEIKAIFEEDTTPTPPTHIHELVHKDKVEASCTKNGTKEHYECTKCGAMFEDKTEHVPLTEEEIIIPAAGHKPSSTYSYDANNHWKVCTVCDEKLEKAAHSFNGSTCTTCNYTKKTYSSGGGGSSTGSTPKTSSATSGNWLQDEKGWYFKPTYGTYPTNSWAKLPWNGIEYWYYFDTNGYMKTGWIEVGGKYYYLNPIVGTNSGIMLTGWQLIDGKWYYFSKEQGANEGMLLTDTVTPDNYKVGKDGVWIQ